MLRSALRDSGGSIQPMSPPADARPSPDTIEVRIPLAELIESLSRPSALVAGESAKVIQTHISVVFLAGERAWKVKKPTRLWGLVDYGTFDARKHLCEEEVRLNRRLAPDIYLGVVPITREPDGLAVAGPGPVVEHAVEMVRLAKGATLLERLQADAIEAEEMERVGRRLAAFHAEHRLERDAARNALPSQLSDVMARNFAGSEGGVPDPFPALVHEGLRLRLMRRLAASHDCIRRRVEEGRAVDGHGDIRLEHVVRFQGRTAIIDCCEFAERLRHIDPLSDAAFLSMDLTVRGRPDLAQSFEHAYLEHSGDPDGAILLPLYRANRAHVRAMVDEQSCRAPEIDEVTHRRKALGARRCLALAWTCARTGAVPPLIVMRGAAGTGKSFLATQLAPWLGAEVIRSDVVRKELLGLEPTWRPADAEVREEVYGAKMRERTYAAVLALARKSVEAGRAAFLDATYMKRLTRDEARALARELAAPFAILDVTCPPEVVRERLIERAERDDDASDANWAVYEEMAHSADPVEGEEAAFLSTFESGRPAEAAVLPLLEVLERQLDPKQENLGPAGSDC